ncbi:hypothetical protein GCM10011613_20950 [Cellvibrio zantedeschiae]|uniref:EfeO-type cupredoxin-like domain-containing protein n=1 Tax=Cellvibrio zantedeschiae TaxID=1237077 RepID=A0ABQ3B675_9GAMM|nr:hypothetical protein [Cellvibrio zantedeschiae]GGY75251.1 hypothetical protein GCM10011613_20950 [Cellvibrio zantedeschiae]
MSFVRRYWLPLLLFSVLVDAVLLIAFIPIQYNSREEVFEIPDGTWANRMAGKKNEILPQQVHLTLGVRDILVLRNLDKVPQMFGPTLIMPNQSFKLPFELASEYQFACTAHVSGQMTVVVDPEPTVGWPRLQWRIKNLARWIGG